MESELTLVGADESPVEGLLSAVDTSRLEYLLKGIPLRQSVGAKLALDKEPGSALQALVDWRNLGFEPQILHTFGIEALIGVALGKVGYLHAVDIHGVVEFVALGSDDEGSHHLLGGAVVVEIGEDEAAVGLRDLHLTLHTVAHEGVGARSHIVLCSCHLLEIIAPSGIVVHGIHDNLVAMLTALKNNLVG